MGYKEEIQQVAMAHVDEIEGDLDRARHELVKLRGDISQLERRIVGLEGLTELAQPVSLEEPSGTHRTTGHGAMVIVLKDGPPHGMRPGDIAAEVNRLGLYRMRDGRPLEAQQVHARTGNYPHLFRRNGSFIQLVDWERYQS